MCSPNLSGDTKEPISIWTTRGSPNPAITGFVYLLPEEVFILLRDHTLATEKSVAVGVTQSSIWRLHTLLAHAAIGRLHTLLLVLLAHHAAPEEKAHRIATATHAAHCVATGTNAKVAAVLEVLQKVMFAVELATAHPAVHHVRTHVTHPS